MVEQAVDAERGIIAHRLVEHCLEILLAVVAQAQLRARLLLVAGLAGDDRDRTGGGVAAEQRALWTLEHLDALDVGEWQQHAAAAAGVDAVDVHAHRRIGADAEVVGADAAQLEARLRWLLAVDHQPGDEAVEVAEVLGSDVLDALRGAHRPEESRVGQAGVSTCRSRWSPYP